MKLLRLTGLLMILSMLVMGCGSDDPTGEEGGSSGEWVDLRVYVRNDRNAYLEGAEVEFVQNGKSLSKGRTNIEGYTECYVSDGLAVGTVTVNVKATGHLSTTKTAKIEAGINEWVVNITADATFEAGITVEAENVEDFYGAISIEMQKNVASVKVSPGSRFDPNNCDEYENDRPGYGTMTQRVTYYDLLPQTKYTFTVASFDISEKQLETKTLSFTTKELYNRSDVKVDVVNFLTISNGMSVTLQSRPIDGFYLVAYEKSKVPGDEKQIIKDAMSANARIKDASVGYVDGMTAGTTYRLYVIPVGKKQSTVGYSVSYFAPGKVSYIDLTTKDNSNIAQAIAEKYSYTNTSFTYHLKSSYYTSYASSGDARQCLSYRGVTVEEYDLFEDEPDIAWATACHNMTLDVFNTTYSDLQTWSGLNLTSWYAIITLGYSDRNGQNNSSIISRYKFKYGSYGVTGRGAVAPVQSSGIRYGGVSNELLKRVHILK